MRTAEWLSAEFFGVVEGPADGGDEDAGERLEEIQTDFAGSTDQIEDHEKKQGSKKKKAEEQFGSEQFAHEINLCGYYSSQHPPHPLPDAPFSQAVHALTRAPRELDSNSFPEGARSENCSVPGG
jgi:hypothetical protein